MGEEGVYDECLPPRDVRRLARLAKRAGVTLGAEAMRRSPVLCSYRPGHAFRGGQCVAEQRPGAPRGGVLLVGDSIAWRGTDELARLQPGFALDGVPTRRLEQLDDRLRWFSDEHGPPDGLILELGTNADATTGLGDLRRIIGSLPADTAVLLVLPYRTNPHAPPRIKPSSTRYAEWMRALAAERENSCVANWRAEVRRAPGLLVDGIHPTARAESIWAEWISSAWTDCLGALGS